MLSKTKSERDAARAERFKSLLASNEAPVKTAFLELVPNPERDGRLPSPEPTSDAPKPAAEQEARALLAELLPSAARSNNYAAPPPLVRWSATVEAPVAQKVVVSSPSAAQKRPADDGGAAVISGGGTAGGAGAAAGTAAGAGSSSIGALGTTAARNSAEGEGPPSKKQKREKKRGQFKNKERQKMAKEQREENLSHKISICPTLAYTNKCDRHVPRPEDSPQPLTGRLTLPAGSCRRDHDRLAKINELKLLKEESWRGVVVPSGGGAGGVLPPTGVLPPNGVGGAATGFPECPVFATHGFCPAGVNCLWAKDHVDMQTGENKFGKDVTVETAVARVPNIQGGFDEVNTFCEPVRNLLRSKKYDFSTSKGVLKKFDRDTSVGFPSALCLANKEGAAAAPPAPAPAVNAGLDHTAKEGSSTAAPPPPAPAVNAGLDHTVEGATAPPAPGQCAVNAGLDHTAKEGATAPPAPTAGQRAVNAGLDTPDRTHDGPALLEKRRLFVLSKKRHLAPLTTVGNLPFRRLCVELGAEVTWSEMALAESILSNHQSELALLKRHHSEKIFGIQITSGSPHVMTQTAQLLQDQNFEFDFLDINAACPLDQLHAKGCGSKLTVREAALHQMIYGMRSVLGPEKLVTCKIRMSHFEDAFNGGRHEALKLIPKLKSWGCDGVTLHGRTARMRYTKKANWGYVQRCKGLLEGAPSSGGAGSSSGVVREWTAAATQQTNADNTVTEQATLESTLTGAAAEKDSPPAPTDPSPDQLPSALPDLLQDLHMPLIGCGDVFSYNQYNHYVENEYVDSVLIGRGALIKPWIFSEIRDQRHLDYTASQRLDLIKKYCQYGLEHWGSDERGVENTRRFLLEWLSFFHRYVPIGLMEPEALGEHVGKHVDGAEGVFYGPQIGWRAPRGLRGRCEMETLLMSGKAEDWIKISEMFLGKVPSHFSFVPKHKSASN